MAKTRLEKTLADYLVIAISPALIMTMVGSLVFFLLEVCYRGQFESRMHWIMFWFVFAAVLIARIAIEEGHEHARMFGLVMGALSAIAVMRFVDAVIVGWVLLGIVWWCSSKLTWDCTLIDDTEDASGEGLLQAAGFDVKGKPAALPPDSARAEPSKPAAKTGKKKKHKSKSKTPNDQIKPQATSPVDLDGNDGLEQQTNPHTPGLWVVYFSLAALPLFGIGQLLIPMQDADRRTYVFLLLAAYVASAIALLLTTSFLGLRRYLRQRKLEMPGSMTRSWLGMGVALLVGLMLIAVLIPRPQGQYTLTAIIDSIDAKARQASQYALLKGDRAQGEGRRIGEQDAKARQPGEAQVPDQKPREPGEARPPGGNPPGNAQGGAPQQPGQGGSDDRSKSDANSTKNGKSDSGSNQKSDQKDQSQASQDRSEGQQNSAKVSGQKQPQPAENQKPNGREPQRDDTGKIKAADASKTQTPPAGNLITQVMTRIAPLVKWILYAALALVGLYLLWRYWSYIVDLLARLWAELLSLFGRKPSGRDAAPGTESPPASRPRRPFASFRNPFFSGASEQMSSAELVCYTFEALEAWSREHAIDRSADQTAIEFADQLGRRVPVLANDAAEAAQLYARVAYALKVPAKSRLDALERLWRKLDV